MLLHYAKVSSSGQDEWHIKFNDGSIYAYDKSGGRIEQGRMVDARWDWEYDHVLADEIGTQVARRDLQCNRIQALVGEWQSHIDDVYSDFDGAEETGSILRLIEKRFDMAHEQCDTLRNTQW